MTARGVTLGAVVAVCLVLGCKKREPSPEEIARLPHVTRHRGKVVSQSFRRVAEHRVDAARVCYDDALAKRPGQSGTITVTTRPKASGQVERTVDRSGDLSVELGACIADAVDDPVGREPEVVEKVVLVLSSEERREPAPPGDLAYRLVVERMLAPAHLTVTELVVSNRRDGNEGGAYARVADCVVKARFDADGDDDFCGELQPPGRPNRRGKAEEGACLTEKREKGSIIELRGPCRFTLRRGGWMFDAGNHEDGRLFYGDVVRGD